MSVDRLKPVISFVLGTPALPPPAVVTRPLFSVSPQIKKVQFFTPVPATQLHWNPYQTVQGSLSLFTVLRPHLLGGVTVAFTTTYLQPPYYRAPLQNLPWQGSYQWESKLIVPFPV